MLAGLLFLGILAAASVPDMLDLMHSRESDPEGDGPDDDAPEVRSLDVDAATGDVPVEDDQADGEDLHAAPTLGRMIVEAFKPGTDTITLAVPDEAQEFSVRDGDDETDAMLRYETGDGPVEVYFSGLSAVPVADIFLRVSDAASPTLDTDISLSQLMEEGEPAQALAPVDPTLPDTPPPFPDAAPRPLLPVDPTLPDEPVDPDREGPVLQPVRDDELAPELDNLAALLSRDGGSPVGLGPTAPALCALGPGDDALVLPVDDSGGTLALSEAAPHLGDGALAVDLGAGDDTLVVGGGAIYGFGGAGADTLVGGLGASALFGGDGTDELMGGDAGDGQTLLNGGSGNDALTAGAGGTYLDGGEHDEAAGATGDDTITGGDGNDTIRGGWGADVLTGGAGDDVIDHRGTDAERITAERHQFAWHVDGAADILDGGAGDDILVMDRGDMATGGAGADVFWLYSDGAGNGHADITDFTPGEDFLRISLNPQIAALGGVAVVVSDDALDGWVQVDGATVAVLRGAPDATLADLYVETRPDVFA